MSSIESMSGLSTSGILQATRGNDSRRAEFEAKFTEAALAAGLDPKAADGLQDEIKAAIAAATQKSDSATDRRQVIQNAIDGVLQKHGVDLEKFKSQMQAGMGGPGSPPPNSGPPGDSRRSDFEAKFKEAALAAGLDPKAADGLQDEIESAISETLKNTTGAADPREAIQDAVDDWLKEHGVDLEKFKSQLQSAMGGTPGMVSLVDVQA
jgi:glycine cleavage system regulatory protein